MPYSICNDLTCWGKFKSEFLISNINEFYASVHKLCISIILRVLMDVVLFSLTLSHNSDLV